VAEKHIERLGDLLLDANLIDEIQLRVALQEQTETGERLGSALVHLGFIDEAVLAAFLSRQADLPCVNIHGLHIPDEILALIPREMAVERSIIPIRRSGEVLYLAMSDPFDEKSLSLAAEASGLNIVPMIAPEFRLKRSIERFYADAPEDPVERPSVELGNLVEEIEEENVEALAGRVGELNDKIDRLTEMVEGLREALEEKL
jgi:type IV pilus assembly protein PilB